MNRRETLILGGVVVILFATGVIQYHGGVRETRSRYNHALKAGLADATSGVSIRAAAPWDSSIEPYEHNSWTCPPWSMASVGVVPLRRDHPLHRQPPYMGHNRHKVMCDGWNGWYYDPPSEETL